MRYEIFSNRRLEKYEGICSIHVSISLLFYFRESYLSLSRCCGALWIFTLTYMPWISYVLYSPFSTLFAVPAES